MTRKRKKRLRKRITMIMRKHGLTKEGAINYHNSRKPKSFIMKFIHAWNSKTKTWEYVKTEVKEKISKGCSNISKKIEEVKYSVEEVIERKRLKIRKKIEDRLKYATLAFK